MKTVMRLLGSIFFDSPDNTYYYYSSSEKVTLPDEILVPTPNKHRNL